MQKLNIYIKNKEISEKGQKIVGALYLVTSHISDNDPIRLAIRTKALSLFDTSCDQSKIATDLTNILKSAGIAKVISDTNATILIRELTYLTQATLEDMTLTSFFGDTQLQPSRTNSVSYKNTEGVTVDRGLPHFSIKNEQKNKRQDQILTFINGRKSAVIKDIVTLFPEVSEKTIQRELGALVDAGKITKRGSKRWSIYMAI